MKRPRYIDFVCRNCGAREERFVETNDDGSVIEQQLCKIDECVEQGAVMLQQEIGVGLGYVQSVNRNNSDFNERQRERLEKRSAEHWEKKGKHEAIARQEAMLRGKG